MKKQCFFCSQNFKQIDHKDPSFLRRYISGQAKIIDTKYSGVCAKHQRALSEAIKRSRFLGLLPFTRIATR